MQLQSKFFLTVSAIAVFVATSLLLVANGGDGGRRMEAADVTADPALESEHRELSRHWFKKTHNPNGLKTWRRNRWAFYVGKQKKGRAYRYYADRPGWNPHPNKPNQKKKSLRVATAGALGDETQEETIVSNAARQLVIENWFEGGGIVGLLDSACDESGKEGVVRNLETNQGDRNDSGSTRWTLENTSGDQEIKVGDQVYVKNLYNGEEWYLGYNNESNVLGQPRPMLVKDGPGNLVGYTTVWTIESMEGKTGPVKPQDQIALQAQGLYLDAHGAASAHSSCKGNPVSGASGAVALTNQGGDRHNGSGTWVAEYV